MRKLSVYEKNQLQKYKIDPLKINWVNIKDTPIEYITGFCNFKGNDFIVNKNVLIPRVETEQIIDIGLKHIKNKNKIIFCDVGTGSGVIGISFAKELEKLKIPFRATLSDVSIKALDICNLNIKKITPNLKKYFSVFRSNLMTNYKTSNKFDIIFANLPYIPEKNFNKLQKSVKNYEPKKALLGGVDGLIYIKKLIKQSKKYLKNDGVIILEVNDTHNKNCIKKDSFFNNYIIETIPDTFNKNRFWVVKTNQVLQK